MEFAHWHHMDTHGQNIGKSIKSDKTIQKQPEEDTAIGHF